MKGEAGRSQWLGFTPLKDFTNQSSVLQGAAKQLNEERDKRERERACRAFQNHRCMFVLRG